MNETIYRKALPSDYPGILRLQAENFIGNIDETVAKDGFLSIEFNEKQFEEMNKDLAVIVAAREDETVGYVCGTSCEYGMRFPIIGAVMKRFPGLSIEGVRLTTRNSFIYGPVCIAAHARGGGVLEGLYGKLKEIAKPGYDFCVLFIADKNRRSLHAHISKLKMKDLCLFEWNNTLFHILCAAV